MKTVITTYIYTLICLATNEITFAQNFAPLNFGNIWVWKDEWGTIRKSTLIDTNYYFNNRYYSKIEYNIFGGYLYAYLDETDSLYYQYQTILPHNDGNLPYYKLNCVIGDTFSYPLAQTARTIISVIDTYLTNVFDTILTIKILRKDDGGLSESFQVWTDEIGCISKMNPQTGSIFFEMKGCVINGRVYGDTSLTVGIEDEYLITHNFKLYQNYPNPFNPITTIEYELNEYALVSLKVYDLLGNEAAVLINEEKYAGRYSIKFDAQGLSSGVYFYKLTIGGNTQVRKMLLLR